MTDIIVSLPASRGGIVHLGEKAEAHTYNEAPYWETRVNLREIERGDKCFVLAEGSIRGYFLIEEFIRSEFLLEDRDADDYHIIDFQFDSWHPIQAISRGAFRGVRYKRGAQNFRVVELVD
jgi:hypothetical protein